MPEQREAESYYGLKYRPSNTVVILCIFLAVGINILYNYTGRMKVFDKLQSIQNQIDYNTGKIEGKCEQPK